MWAWASWAAAARTRRARSRGSSRICAATTSSGWRPCDLRSAIRPPACTTTARSSMRRSNSPASTSSEGNSAFPCMRCWAASCAIPWSSRAICSSVTQIRKPVAAKCVRPTSSWPRPRHCRLRTGSARTSSKAASSRPRTSSRAIARWRRIYPATVSATTRTARCRSPMRSSSAAASKTSRTTISKTRCGECRNSRASRSSCPFPSRRTR